MATIEDFAEGVRAFAEKRKSTWKARVPRLDKKGPAIQAIYRVST